MLFANLKSKVLTLSTLFLLAPQLAFAQHGGGAGATGGGSADPGPPMMAYEIKEVAEKSQATVAAFYKYLSVMSGDISLAQSIWTGMGSDQSALRKKLFAGTREDAIIRKVYSVAPVVLENGPCQDIYGNSKDGSGLTNPDRICISVEMLEKRGDLKTTNGKLMIMALVAHEYSHLLGANEDEANFIQKTLAPMFLSNQSFKTAQEELEWHRSDLDDQLESVDGLLSTIQKQKSAASICAGLGVMKGSFPAIERELLYSREGVSLLDQYESKQFRTAEFAFSNTLSFCNEDVAANNKIFGKRTEMPLREYVRATQPNAENFRPSDLEGRVVRIGFGDYKNLQIQVSEIRARIKAANDDRKEVLLSK